MELFNNYSSIIETGLSCGYNFVGFSEISKANNYSIVVRHDVDSCVQLGLEMARIESSLGIKSTFFLMLRSPFYNLLTRANNNAVKEIIKLGHEIGLHYDEGYYSRNENLQQLINEELQFIETNFDININVVSFHQPSPDIISNLKRINQINTYDKKFFKHIKYLSDSNMVFSEDPIELIKSRKHQKIQLLIHPMWWMIEGDSTEEKFTNTIKMNFEIEQQQILATERAYGDRKIIKLTKL